MQDTTKQLLNSADKLFGDILVEVQDAVARLEAMVESANEGVERAVDDKDNEAIISMIRRLSTLKGAQTHLSTRYFMEKDAMDGILS